MGAGWLGWPGLESMLWLGLALLWSIVGVFAAYMRIVIRREQKKLGVFFIAVFWLLIVTTTLSVTAYALSILF